MDLTNKKNENESQNIKGKTKNFYTDFFA